MFNNTPIKSANQLATLIGVLPADSWVTLGYRPHRENGGFGDERKITFQMRKLDTGSTKYEKTRFAKPAIRKTSRLALSRNVGKGQARMPGATVVFQGPGKEKIEIYRLGEKLRWSNGQMTLVRTAAGAGRIRG